MLTWNRLTTAGLSLALIVLLGVVARLAADASGGSLDPVGPPASTQSIIEPRVPIVQPALATGFPIVISQPGSYYLASNITGVASKSGIEITTGNVTLDLNGFHLTGVTNSGSGVLVTGGVNSNITIRNGTIAGWTHGIDAIINHNGRYSDLQLLDNSSSGIKTSSASTIARVSVRGSSTGISMAPGTSGGLIIDSIIMDGFFPLSIGGDSVVVRRTIVGPTGQLVNHHGAALWLDESQMWGGNFAFVLDGAEAVVTRNTMLENASFAGIGVNNHVGTSALLGAGTISSADVWSNVRY